MTDHLITLFTRDIEKLKQELHSYDSEEDLWNLAPGINNSAGNLALHLIGNLNHFIGSVLGNSDYQRDRESEFNDKHVPLEEMIHDLDNTVQIIQKTLNVLTKQRLEENYPIEVFGGRINTSFFLIHLYGHLNYHLGQINYHRRLIS